MSAAAKLAKAREQAASGKIAKSARLAWDAANAAMTEHDVTTLAGVELLATELAPFDESAKSLVTYCAAVLAGGPGEVRAATVLDKYFRREPKRIDCPRCGESIARSAVICRFCGADLATSEG